MSKNLEMNLLLDFYGQLLTKKQRDVMELYYYEDLSLAEISEYENITRQGVHDSLKRAEIILKDYEEKLGLAEKSVKLRESMKIIMDNADMICSESDSEKIHKYSCIIKNTAEEFYDII